MVDKFEFKDELKGDKLILKRTSPILETAKAIFSAIDSNKDHLIKWFPWVAKTEKIEDSMSYLFEKFKEEKEGKKIEYGIYVDDLYIGNISIFDLSKSNRSGEIGYWIIKDQTRKGYVTEAVKILEKEFFENQDINRIQIKCDERNEASAGVAKKCGYIFEGKLREDDYCEHFKGFRNTLIFSKLKSEYK